MDHAKTAIFALALSFILLAGCASPPKALPSGPHAGCEKYPQTTSMVSFLSSGEHACVEVADTPMKRERGLMFRKSMGDDEGMLFVFERTQTLRFWMHNTQVPLTIVFFDESKRVVDIKQMYPCDPASRLPCPIYESKVPAKYALELSPKFFVYNEIKEGEYASWD